MDLKKCKAAIEAILFAHGDPISTKRIALSIELDETITERLILQIKDDLDQDERGLTILKIEDKWQMSTKNEYSMYVKIALDKSRNVPLSQAALETLAIIAYNQPISRSFIEQVRGVDSTSSVQSLMNKGLIEEAGRLDLPGRPISFKTTDVFLRIFGISSLSELPSLHDELPEMNIEDE